MPDDQPDSPDSSTRTLLRQPIDLASASVPKGQVYVIPERCKGCRYCIQFCPNAVLVESHDINAKGYHFPVVAEGKEDACVHCRFCDLVCLEMAIFTEDISETDEDNGERTT